MKSAFTLVVLLTLICAAPCDSEGNNFMAQEILAAPSCGNPANARSFYRLYRSADTDHLYTLNANEAQSAVNLGYKREGVSSYIFPSSQPGTVPLYRVYSPSAGDHLYTTSVTERNSAIQLGYKSEGVAGYIYPNANCDGVPFYRVFSASGGDHLYTTSTVERDSAIRGGYKSEGIAGYVYPY